MEPARFFTKLIQSLATVVEVSEATVFALGDKPADPPRLMLHVRPGNATKEQIANALKVFNEVVKGCVGRNQDMALLVNDPRQKDAPVKQFCLTHLVRQQKMARFAVSFVSRCRTPEEATKKVALLARFDAIWQDQLSFDAPTAVATTPQTAEVADIAPPATEGAAAVGGDGIATTAHAGEPTEPAPDFDTAESSNS